MQLNCDLGESFGVWCMGQDAEIMPYIDMANIACGFHASDPLTIENTLALAIQHQVALGAHPGYPDLLGFGRRSMKCSPDEIRTLLLYQVSAISGMAQVKGHHVSYIKPHGALYNDMMLSDTLMDTIMQTVAMFPESLALVIQGTQSNDDYRERAEKYGIRLMFEAFADRAYDDDGWLLPRSQVGAVFHESQQILDRVEQLAKEGVLYSASGKRLTLSPDTLCVHGDNPQSIALVKDIRQVLDGL